MFVVVDLYMEFMVKRRGNFDLGRKGKGVLYRVFEDKVKDGEG